MPSTDILIIGGGVAGLSLAAELSRDASVILLEREGVFAYHASGRSAAAFVPGYGNRVVQTLTGASEAFYLDNELLTPRGMMLLARPGEEAAFESEARDFGLVETDFDAALGRVPVLRREAISRIGAKDSVWDIDTDRLLQTYVKTARKNGAELRENADVTSIKHDGSRWHVTATDMFQAEFLVNAAGAWADDVASMASVAPLGIVPHKRSVARVAAPDGVDVSDWPFLDGVNERWYAKPDAGALIISRADETPVAPHDVWAEDVDLATGIARYEEMVTVPVARMLANWAGLRSFAPDRSLVLGGDAEQPSFFWCAGQGGYGFQTAPAAARFLAGRILDRPSDLDADIAAALSPKRFS